MICYNILYHVVVVLQCWLVQHCINGSPQISIAIVGGGIGGTSCSHFLWELLGDNIEVDLYEEKEIGGRMATIEVNGKEYESGGSIIHPANLYMKTFLKALGLKQHKSEDGKLAIFNGEEIVFDGSRYHFMMVAQLFYHYGWDIYRINKYVKNLLSKFERIYQHQSSGYAFTTVDNLLRSMDDSFVEMIHRPVTEDMTKWGFGKRFLNELVLGGLRTNYGQGLGIQSFVGAVSMAGIEPGLWSVEGGNKRIPINLLKKSSSTVHRATVTEVVLTAHQPTKYSVQSVESTGAVHTAHYDFVVIAAPLFNNMGAIKFTGFPEPIIHSHYNFHRTVATFVKGKPKMKSFNLDDIDEFPENLLTCNEDLFYNSIGKHSPVDSLNSINDNKKQTNHIYKIFSKANLTGSQLDKLFHDREKVKVVDWLAYPEYPSETGKLPSFQLHNQMFYINAIEMAASAMEMSAIGAKNVALLVHNKIRSQMEYTDSPDLTTSASETKHEL